MLNSDALRRLAAVALLAASLIMLPSAPALAAGDGAEEDRAASESEDSGLMEKVIEWFGDLFAPETGENGPQADPMG